ncbi:MAG: hypothetical protein R3B45_14625 [Bdellovibrionota bacterium]
MFAKISIVFIILNMFFSFGLLFGVVGNNKTDNQPFEIHIQPSKLDWQYFMKADEEWRQRLWNYYNSQGKGLSQWAWQWRLGWVRKCGASRLKYCDVVLKSALFDAAAVVRGEAATRIGGKYYGSKDSAIIDLLAKAFKNKLNYRGKKPLFVQQRILFAIWSIGGKHGHEVGKFLAKGHTTHLAYWDKISNGAGL